jgi:hypothetical protein
MGMDNLPRVENVSARRPTTLRVKWRGGPSDDIDLAGWIATGGDILTQLSNPVVFDKVSVSDYGAAVAWDDDLRIDAVHLKRIARKQRQRGYAPAPR